MCLFYFAVESEQVECMVHQTGIQRNTVHHVSEETTYQSKSRIVSYTLFAQE